MAAQNPDLVMSCAAGTKGPLPASYGPVMQALKNGYRVVDVFTNSVSLGGASTDVGGVIVTVVLTRPNQKSYYRPQHSTAVK